MRVCVCACVCVYACVCVCACVCVRKTRAAVNGLSKAARAENEFLGRSLGLVSWLIGRSVGQLVG